MTTFSYPEVGATRWPDAMPDGYHHLHHRVLIGRGKDVFEAAGLAVSTFRMHRAVGVRIRADAERAAPGVAVECAIGIGPVGITAPCEVVWCSDTPDRIGFAYGTRQGHPECGEESFMVEMDGKGAVWFAVHAFSRPGRWYTRLAGPVVPVFQRAYARRCGKVLRRLARG